MNLFLLGIMAALSAFSLAYCLLDMMAGEGSFETRKIHSRIEDLLQYRQPSTSLRRKVRFSSIERLNSVIQRQKIWQRLSELLILSGWRMSLAVFVILDLLWGFLVYFFVRLIFKIEIMAAIAGFFMSAMPYWILVINRARYVEKFTLLFPDALMMMKNALKAGQGIQAAFHIVGEEGPKPVSNEFTQMCREIELGSQINEALNALYRRIHTLDLRIFVLGIFIQQEVGGNLVELFQHIESTIRERLSLMREVKALSAQGKMTGIVLILLPIALTGALAVINPTYFTPLIEDPQGRKVLMAAICMQVVGALIIRKMTKFSMSS